MLSIDQITVDHTLNVRAAIDEETVERYAAVFDRLPPVIVYHLPGDGVYLLADGFHRVEAARRLGFEEIPAEVREGTRDDAEEYALTANVGHGRTLTRAERRRAIARMVRLHPEQSDAWIARDMGVSSNTVRLVREELEATSQIAGFDRLVGADGKERPREIEQGGGNGRSGIGISFSEDVLDDGDGRRPEKRYDGYIVGIAQEAHDVVYSWLARVQLDTAIEICTAELEKLRAPHVWRVSLLNQETGEWIGEAVVDANTSLMEEGRTTRVDMLRRRLGIGREDCSISSRIAFYRLPAGLVVCGDSAVVLADLTSDSVDLVFTSPPYYNTRPEYGEFVDYDEYLASLRSIIGETHRVLKEGRFFAINVSPILLRRFHRNAASTRIAVPFDVHPLFIEAGYDFIDDIIWRKTEGAGWSAGRGCIFAAHRSPLQYKPVPVTEYILIYRKHSERLLDWNINSYPGDVREASRVEDGYERTNVWEIAPAHDPRHPAVFPLKLAERVIRYYSFVGDVVLDPYAGIGTVGKAAVQLNRRFVLIEREPKYVDIIVEGVNE